MTSKQYNYTVAMETLQKRLGIRIINWNITEDNLDYLSSTATWLCNTILESEKTEIKDVVELVIETYKAGEGLITSGQVSTLMTNIGIEDGVDDLIAQDKFIFVWSSKMSQLNAQLTCRYSTLLLTDYTADLCKTDSQLDWESYTSGVSDSSCICQ